MKKAPLLCSLIFMISMQLFAQHIREQDIAYTRFIVREIDLRQPENIKVFGIDAVLSSILLDGIKNGAKAYDPLHPSTVLPYHAIMERLQIPSPDSCIESYEIEELYRIELTEQFIFDKHRSEFRFVPLYMTVFIPAEISVKGIMEPVMRLYVQDYTTILRQDTRAFIAGTKIGQPAVNMNEQLILRSYQSTIVKIGNEEDQYFDQRYNDPYKAFLAMKEEENAIQEMIYAAYHPQ